MRVLMTVPSLEPAFGGPATKAPVLARHLRCLGVTVRIAGAGPPPPDDTGAALALGRLGGFHGTPLPRRLRPLLGAVADADVVHVIGLRDPVGTLAAAAARRRGVPVVVEPVGMHRRRLRSQRLKATWDRLIGDRIIEGAAVVVATSPLERDELVADGVDEGRIVVRPNGVQPVELLPPGRFRQRLGIPEEAPVVVHIGRIAAKKGLVDLADVCRDVPGVHLVIAGPDDRDGTLEALRRRSHGRLHVLAGGVWGPDKGALLADADVFALPSATENFAIAAAEAACAGVPTVVSDRTGVAAWMGPPAHRVVPYGDRDALAVAIADLATPEARAAAEAAAPGLRAEFDWSRIAARQLEIYERALAGR